MYGHGTSFSRTCKKMFKEIFGVQPDCAVVMGFQLVWYVFEPVHVAALTVLPLCRPQVVSAHGEPRSALDLKPKLNYSVQVRCSGLDNPPRWSDWSESYHIYLDSKKIPVTAGGRDLQKQLPDGIFLSFTSKFLAEFSCQTNICYAVVHFFCKSSFSLCKN